MLWLKQRDMTLRDPEEIFRWMVQEDLSKEVTFVQRLEPGVVVTLGRSEGGACARAPRLHQVSLKNLKKPAALGRGWVGPVYKVDTGHCRQKPDHTGPSR